MDASGFAVEQWKWRYVQDQGTFGAGTKAWITQGLSGGGGVEMVEHVGMGGGVPRRMPALETDRIKEVRDVVPGFLVLRIQVVIQEACAIEKKGGEGALGRSYFGLLEGRWAALPYARVHHHSQRRHHMYF